MPKKSSKNEAIAKNIVDRATITALDNNVFDINLIAVVGYRKEVRAKKEEDAKKEVVEYLTKELDDGNLVLSTAFTDSL
jgi:hypothetical protein